jgi:uncharacterized FlaG/YvyC family protein
MKVNEISAVPMPVPTQKVGASKGEGTDVEGTAVARQIFAENGNTLPPPESVLPQEPAAPDLSELAEQLTRNMQSMSRELKFTVNRDVDRTVVQVTNPATGETIRQIPSEEFIALAEALRTASEDSLRGYLYDSEA